MFNVDSNGVIYGDRQIHSAFFEKECQQAERIRQLETDVENYRSAIKSYEEAIEKWQTVVAGLQSELKKKTQGRPGMVIDAQEKIITRQQQEVRDLKAVIDRQDAKITEYTHEQGFTVTTVQRYR